MAKIIMAWPPLKDPKGYATSGQNRQFSWAKSPFFAYPIIPATFMTMLLASKQETLWVDSIADELNEVDFGRIVIQMNPDYIVFEAQTPLIKRYWEIINGFKLHLPNIKIILCGEHVTALLEESKVNCKADYILQGGKWYYEAYKIITGKDWQGKLPHIDRNATRWWSYAYKNGNYKYIPGTYIMSAHDCWWRPGCSFCSWANYHKECVVRPVEDVLEEIEKLINMGFKEIFDDSGTFPVGDWLKTFCQEIIDRGYNRHVSFGCNMRFGVLTAEEYKLLGKAGFRMILYGLESVNQETLNLLNKGYKVQSVSQDLLMAKAAGLQSHLAVMFGYPWETYQEAKRTSDMVKYWLKTGWAFSAQASICVPYPGTPLFDICKKNNLLTTEDWTEYDQTKTVMKIPYPEKELFKLRDGIYNIAFHPKFLWQRIKQVKGIEDFKYYMRIGRKLYDRWGNFYEIGKVSVD